MSDQGKTKTLLVFAHADEAIAFTREGLPCLITGVGKINATLELTRALLTADEPVTRVVVLGTAGGITENAQLDTVYRITAAVQHDFSLTSPRIDLPAVGDEAAAVTDIAMIATGDVFVQSDEQRMQLSALGASLVDMEVYAYATVCAQLGVALEVYKTPSDFADSATTMQTWDDIVHAKSEQLLEFARQHLPKALGAVRPASPQVEEPSTLLGEAHA